MDYVQVNHLSASALSWDAMLNVTKVELELISDLDMYIFFEKGMRGGVSYISNRSSKVNNKYLKSYDPKQESKHIICLGPYYMENFCPGLKFQAGAGLKFCSYYMENFSLGLKIFSLVLLWF